MCKRNFLSGNKYVGLLVVILIGFLLNGNQGLSQAPDLKNVISSTSPGAAALAKYIDFPVSLSNGLPQISIPLYELKSSRISIPVSLGYHGGGVKVGDRTSTLGLGWNLNAGGSISRSSRGLPDESQYGFLNMVWPADDGSAAGASPADAYCLANRIYNRWAPGLSDNLYDGEPDTYYYNAPNLGGKFLYRNSVDASGQRAVTIPFAPIKISSTYVQNNQIFTITSTDGTQYIFGDQNGVATDYTFDQTATNALKTIVSAWHLTKIISADKSDEITFNYQAAELFADSRISTSLLSSYSQYMAPGTDPTAVISHSSSTRYETNALLTSIVCKTGKVIFTYGTSGTYQPLQTVDIYSTLNGVDQKIKSFSFGNSLFTGSSLNTLKLDNLTETGFKDGTTIANPPYSFTYSTTDAPPYNTTKQDFWGYYNGWTNTTGNTDNDNLLLANVVNGKIVYAPEKRTPNPLLMGKAMLQRITFPTGGFTDFNVEPNQIQAQVPVTTPGQPVTQHISTMNIYPGSGTAGNDITFYPITNGNGTAQFTFSGTLFCSSGANCILDVPEVKLLDVTSNGTIFDQTLSLLSNGNQTTQVITQTLAGIDPTHQYRLYFPNSPTLANNTQNFKFRLDVNFTETPPNVTIFQQQTVYAGGLRIINITTDDGKGNVLKKDYNYTKPYFTSTAFQGDFYYLYANCLTQSKYFTINLLSVNDPNHMPLPTDPYGTYLTSKFYQESPSYPFGGSSNCGIAYEEVEEVHSAANGTNIGKTVYTFNKALDYIPNRLPSIRVDREFIRTQLKNEKISKIENGVYIPIKETQNSYINLDNNEADAKGTDDIKFFIANSDYDFNKYAQEGGAGTYPFSGFQAPGCPIYSLAVPFTLIPLYYHVTKNLLDNTKVIEYDPINDPNSLHPFITTTQYTYGNYAHMLPTAISTTTSDQQQKKQLISYPLDYTISGTATNAIAQGIQNLQNNHVLTPPVEQTVQKSNTDGTNTRTTSSILTTYKPTLPYPDIVYATESALPMSSFAPATVSASAATMDNHYQPRIIFDTYDASGNLLQQHKVNDKNLSYVWDYSNTYPVAQAVNASSSDIAYTSFESDGSGNWNIISTARNTVSSITGKQSYELSNGAISKTGLTVNAKYILSYWAQAGSRSITAATPGVRTGRTVGAWTYYEWSLVASSSTVNLMGTGLIDELRLYPESAQMTSYTYDPLIGQTSMTDPNGEITYYEYDGLNRLKNIKDYQGNIIKNFQYNYMSSCGNNCVVLPMQTFNGSNTIGYPVGVFNVNRQLLGNATSQAQYLTLWNGNAANQAKGVLAAGTDALHFNLTLAANQTAPSAITGLRYYQMDLNYTVIDAVQPSNCAYVDFGDGTSLNTQTGSPLPANTTMYGPSTPNGQYILATVWYKHTYPDNSVKTLTFYHNDANENPVLFNYSNPGTSLTKLSNLRGNFPQFMTRLGGAGYASASVNSVANITNWSTISSVKEFIPYNGDAQNPCTNMNYSQDFMAANKDLTYIHTDVFALNAGYRDTNFKISRLKSDWNTYFTNLGILAVNEDHWNHEDISGLKKLWVFALTPSSGSVGLNSTVMDNAINQIWSGAGMAGVKNGGIFFVTGGSTRTSASDAAWAQLKSAGWVLWYNGTPQQN